jgi:RHS repeat-associated protein
MTCSKGLVVFALLGASCAGRISASAGRRGYAAVDTTSNQIGRLTTSGDSNSRTSYAYDALGRVVGTEHDYEANRFVFQSAYGYPQGTSPGPGSVLVGQTFPDGELVQYGYDASGAQISITAGGEPVVRSIHRNAQGHMTEVDYGDDTVTRRTYRDNLDLRLGAIATTGPGGTPLQSYHYAFDPAGNVLGVDDDCLEDQPTTCGTISGPDSASYGYDSLGQLTSMTSEGSHSFGYDAIGNLTNLDGRTQTYPAGGQAHPHAPAGSSGESLSYDANGNLLSGPGGLTVAWNAENMAISLVRGPRATTKAFRGEVVWKKVEAGTTTYYLPSLRVENGKHRKQFGPFAERDPDDTSCGAPAGCLKFYHRDHLGSSALVTRVGAQPIAHRASYFPYGGDRKSAGNFTPRYQWNAKEPELTEPDLAGIYDFGARVYSPQTGRWLSPDVKLEDGLNRYAFVANNPLKYNDPTGHKIVVFSDIQEATLKAVRGLSPGAYIDDKGELHAGDVDKAHSKGHALLQALEESKNEFVVINNTGKGNRSTARFPVAALSIASQGKGVGSGGALYFDPSDDGTTYTWDHGTLKRQPSPTSISLGHELVHLLHMDQGELEKGDVIYAWGAPWRMTFGISHSFTADMEELGTVGLLDLIKVGTRPAYRKSGWVDENVLRAEEGLSPRAAYSSR